MGRILGFAWKHKLTWFVLVSGLILLFCVVGLSEELGRRTEELDEVKSHLDKISERTNALWEERLFVNEMQENLAYYLPDGFVSKVIYTGLKPLDWESGRARVFFNYRGENYSVDFLYSEGKNDLNIRRESPVVRAN